ncbi:MAG TPA: class I SAM-dependent methyltransferase [Anaerolineae bacterium]|nr:class I SAM-dependent methyltransferase [Anaerolineae bacterium]
MFLDRLAGLLSPGTDAIGDQSLEMVRSFPIPEGWGGGLFQLPEPVITALLRLIQRKRLLRVLELGTGFGATACVIAAEFQMRGRGRVTTIDRAAHEPVNVRALAEHCRISPEHLDIVVDPSGYIWRLGRMIAAAGATGRLEPQFDLCLIDGAHEWDPDAGAFFLADQLLRPGGYMVLDDLTFRLTDVPDAAARFPGRTAEQLETTQMRLVWDLLVRPHPDYGRFTEIYGGRVGVAKKRGWG